MKASGTLKFFAAVVVALALLCIVFPKNGIALGGVTLRFPSLHKVLVREQEKSMDQLLVKHVERDMSAVIFFLRVRHVFGCLTTMSVVSTNSLRMPRKLSSSIG